MLHYNEKTHVITNDLKEKFPPYIQCPARSKAEMGQEAWDLAYTDSFNSDGERTSGYWNIIPEGETLNIAELAQKKASEAIPGPSVPDDQLIEWFKGKDPINKATLQIIRGLTGLDKEPFIDLLKSNMR